MMSEYANTLKDREYRQYLQAVNVNKKIAYEYPCAIEMREILFVKSKVMSANIIGKNRAPPTFAKSSSHS